MSAPGGGLRSVVSRVRPIYRTAPGSTPDLIRHKHWLTETQKTNGNELFGYYALLSVYTHCALYSTQMRLKLDNEEL